MTREELEAVIWAVLGIHATQDKVQTVLLAADSYARGAVRPVPEREIVP